MAIFNSSLQIDIKQNKKIMLAAAIYHENLNFRNPALINGIRLVLLRFYQKFGSLQGQKCNNANLTPPESANSES
jgi:hypothetical protein